MPSTDVEIKEHSLFLTKELSFNNNNNDKKTGSSKVLAPHGNVTICTSENVHNPKAPNTEDRKSKAFASSMGIHAEKETMYVVFDFLIGC